MALGKVYTFGPTFRAEKSYDTRHAAEFWMIEPEMAFADLNTYMDTAEAMTKYVIRYLLDNCPDELAFFNQFFDKGLIERLELVANSDFARVSYTDAIELLKKNDDNFQYKVSWGIDLQTEHERYLTEQVFKKPVFVTDYPKEIKAFYMRMNEDGKTVAAADMLVPGIGELIGGSQREERLDVLEEQLRMLATKQPFFEQHDILASVNVDGPTLLALRQNAKLQELIATLPWMRFELVEHVRLPQDSSFASICEYGPLWLDDFGTGMANFSALSEVRYDYIKVARDLFIMLRQTPEGRNLFTLLLQLMNRYCQGVIVEGVETLEEWRDVQHSPAAAAQGYFLSRPVPMDTLDTVITNL